jgi:hypothetical protein
MGCSAVELARSRVAAAGRGHRITVITGDVYSVDEARDRLDHTGWRFTGHRPLAGPQSLVVAQAASATGSRFGF